MSPCVLCPNWVSKDLKTCWFDLPGPVKALTGIQRTFIVSQDTTLQRMGDDAPAVTPAAAEPRLPPQRGLEDWS